MFCRLFFFNDTATTEIYTLSLHDALPICIDHVEREQRERERERTERDEERRGRLDPDPAHERGHDAPRRARSEEHTSELQSRLHLVCRLLLEKKKKHKTEQLHIVNQRTNL